ncbi:MAG TPA: DUF883 domain-containing protein [Planctomycetota bacterium]|nr:DUF883 domain-containing protein [Planctomycetota bacterium]
MESATNKTETQELREKLDVLKQDFVDVARTAKARAVDGTTQWVREHPLAGMGIAAGLGAGVGLAIGLLVGRNRS